MNTAISIYNPNESGDNNPDYLIPEHVSLEPAKSSSLDQDESKSTSVGEDPSPDIPVALVPPMSPLEGKFKLLQLWEGLVVEVRDSEFDAIIFDKTNPELADELVTFDSAEITPDDLSLLKSGSVFYWSVGYSNYLGRGRIRESKIRFRRLKGWSKKEIDHSKKIGKQFAEFFRSDSVCSPKT